MSHRSLGCHRCGGGEGGDGEGPRDFGVLSEADCRRLLASTPVGRVIYTSGALPAAVPLNFAMDGEDIVFRTAPGSKLDAAMAGAIVAFEIDQIDINTRSGRSVLVVGRAAHEAAPDAIAHLDQLALESCMVGSAAAGSLGP